MFHVEKFSGPKAEYYPALRTQLQGILHGERDWLAGLANASAVLFMLPDLNWAGFYLHKGGELVLGPFQGKPACVRIAFGKGVCGTAAATGETQVVPDVHAFPGHIACDAASNSEIVVPMYKEGRLLGVLDIDSPVKNRFDATDREYLEQIVADLVAALDWPPQF
jgi:L-methionine (R)-S-oxide reductase